jgi:hypothetical protein
MTNAKRDDRETRKTPPVPSAMRFAVGLTLALSGVLTVATLGTCILLLVGVLIAGRRARSRRRGAAIAWSLAGSVVGCVLVASALVPYPAVPQEQVIEGGWIVAWVCGVPQIACAVLNAIVLGTVPLPSSSEPRKGF